MSCSPECRCFTKKVHYFSYNCVVLFDANVSLYFVIGCSGFQTRTQPRYSRRFETVILYAHIDWVIEVWPLAVYDLGRFQHIFNRGILCSSPKCFRNQSFVLVFWKVACKCQDSALITGSSWSNRFKVFSEQMVGWFLNLITCWHSTLAEPATTFVISCVELLLPIKLQVKFICVHSVDFPFYTQQVEQALLLTIMLSASSPWFSPY